MTNRNNWHFETLGRITDFTDKAGAVAQYIGYMLNRTQSMFEYEGLPDTLPQRELELMLQTNGWISIPIPDRVPAMNGNIYAFAEGAALGGERNVYYMPTICTVASPALDWSASLRIDEDCIIIPNDSMYMGLLPMFSRYATLLAENDISIRLADINSRIISLITAPDDRTLKSAQGYLKDVADGKQGVIDDNAFLDGIRTQPYATSPINITQLIELQQYLKAGWFNDIGLNANYNMKREAINSTEAQLNDDALLPLALDMLKMRRHGFDRLNVVCGTNIRVRLANSWKVREDELNETPTEEVETDDVESSV